MPRLRLLLVVAVLSGCATYESFEPPPLDYSDRTPLRFAVDSVSVQSAYTPPGRPPQVEHTLILSPEEALRRLLEQRLEAAGGAGRLQAVIVDASVEDETLETETGVAGWLTTQPAARLTSRVKVRVDQVDDTGMVTRSVTTAATRSRSVPEGATFVERQRIAYELVRDLVDDLDAALVAALRESFGELIVA
jgi:hypothetical protein